MDVFHRAKPGHRRGSQAWRGLDRRGAVRHGSRRRHARSAGPPGDDRGAQAPAGMRRPAGAGPPEAGAACLLQWLEQGTAGREIQRAGQHREDLAAPQHDGYPGVSGTGMMAYSEDHIALAAEYALGTLDADERVQVETMMAVDPEFTALVEAWERKLGPLNQMVGSVEPRPELWEKIRTAVGLAQPQMPLVLPEAQA